MKERFVKRKDFFHSKDKGNSQKGINFVLLGNLTILKEARTLKTFPITVIFKAESISYTTNDTKQRKSVLLQIDFFSLFM